MLVVTCRGNPGTVLEQMDQAAAWTHAQVLSTSKKLPNQQAKLLTGLTSWLGNQICHWASFILPDAQQNQIAKKLVRRGGRESCHH